MHFRANEQTKNLLVKATRYLSIFYFCSVLFGINLSSRFFINTLLAASPSRFYPTYVCICKNIFQATCIATVKQNAWMAATREIARAKPPFAIRRRNSNVARARVSLFPACATNTVIVSVGRTRTRNFVAWTSVPRTTVDVRKFASICRSASGVIVTQDTGSLTIGLAMVTWQQYSRKHVLRYRR